MDLQEKHLLDGKKNLHFIGIGGSGMFPLVQILHAKGYHITGSDVNEGDIIDRERKMGIAVSIGHAAQNVHGADIVIYSAAIMKGNPEVDEASAQGIPCVERSVLLGYLTRTYPSAVCIAGTHGKTTATSMTTQILVMAQKDPAAVIGGKLPLIDGYGRHGDGSEIVVESCEYSNTFLHLDPNVSVLLNVDADHLEFFKTMDNLKATFRKFVCLTKDVVIVNADDANSMEVVDSIEQPMLTFGVDSDADYRAINITEHRPSFFAFDVEHKGTVLAHIALGAPGRHNVYNGLAAFICATLAGCTPEECATGLSAFRGAGRRFEFLGEVNGVTIADDYAHHPTELAAALSAAKKMDYNAVWAVFQPFTYTRTQMLLDDFAEVLQIADHVVMTEIMGSRERAEDYTVRTKDLAVKIPDSVWFDTFDEVVAHVMQHAKPGDLVMTLGCGDIYKAAKKMLKYNAE